jgi:hypothetical protein
LRSVREALACARPRCRGVVAGNQRCRGVVVGKRSNITPVSVSPATQVCICAPAPTSPPPTQASLNKSPAFYTIECTHLARATRVIISSLHPSSPWPTRCRLRTCRTACPWGPSACLHCSRMLSHHVKRRQWRNGARTHARVYMCVCVRERERRGCGQTHGQVRPRPNSSTGAGCRAACRSPRPYRS